MQNDLVEKSASSVEDEIVTADNSNEEEIHLPTDPTEWNLENIKTWIAWVTKEFNLQPPPDFNRFPSNGQELVEFTRADFWVCAGSKYGGNTLAKHLAYLQHTATGRCTSPLNNDNDPGISYSYFILFTI